MRNVRAPVNHQIINATRQSIPSAFPSSSTNKSAIAEVLHACDAKIAALERESALLDELFRALLEELMTGRVAVAGSGIDGTDRHEATHRKRSNVAHS